MTQKKSFFWNSFIVLSGVYKHLTIEAFSFSFKPNYFSDDDEEGEIIDDSPTESSDKSPEAFKPNSSDNWFEIDTEPVNEEDNVAFMKSTER